jgi:tetratricopeptide (TPR) repeat protein
MRDLRHQQMLAEARRRHGAGDAPGALVLCRELLKAEPSNPRALYLMGTCELSLGQTEAARRTLRRAIEKSPGDVGAYHDLALAYKRDGLFEEAHRALDAAIALRPDDAVLRGAKAGVFQMTGDHERAYEAIRPVLASGHTAAALALARLAPKVGRVPEAIGLLRAVTSDEGLAAPVRADAWFTLGHLLDGAGEADAAFGAFRCGNVVRGGVHDAPGHSRGVDEVLGAWTREAAARLPAPPVRTERPVFIVGMPRSGTSLVEQILSSHAAVFGAGELNDIGRAAHALAGPRPGVVALVRSPGPLTRGAVERIEREYMDTLRRLAPSATRVTDKMPTNFLHLGLIAAAFPRSRVIHCVRDAMDTCWSCYTQNFSGNLIFTRDLAALGRFFRDYERLMAHWKAVLDIPILDVVYEDLVRDVEGWSRRMVEFTGLAWDDACLRYHESGRVTRTASNDQVRRPVYTSSIGRWRKYEKHLGPLKAALGDP